MSRTENRIGALCAIMGSILLFLGTYWHPSGADPNEAAAAFSEYAADRLWVASHLTQLTGVVFMVVALLCLTRQLEARGDAGWARVAAGGAIASLAVATVLQAVDGIALKVMVDTWAAAPAAQKEATFYAAFAVRQVEVGLASMLSFLLGLTATVYGRMLLSDRMYPRWLGMLAIIGGVRPASRWPTRGFPGWRWPSICRRAPCCWCGCSRWGCPCGDWRRRKTFADFPNQSTRRAV